MICGALRLNWKIIVKSKDVFYYDSINDIMDNNNIDLIINFALKTKRLLKKEDKDDTGVT